MEKINFNGLDKTIYPIGFGTWQLGGALNIAGNPLSYGVVDEAEARESIREALNNGINFFDTADIYGLGKSERILGEELKNKRDEVVICSKVGNVPDGVKGVINDGSYNHIIASCDRSLQRLQTDYMDIYLLHFIPKKEERENSLAALRDLKKGGKIKTYGISVAHNIIMIGELHKDFPVIEGYYNLLLKDAEKFKDIFKSKDKLFIAASPLSRGLLSEKNYDNRNFSKEDVRYKWKEGEAQHEWYKNQKNQLSRLEYLSKQWNIPIKSLAINYILENSRMVVIPGIKSREQLYEIIGTKRDYPLSVEKVLKLKNL